MTGRLAKYYSNISKCQRFWVCDYIDTVYYSVFITVSDKSSPRSLFSTPRFKFHFNVMLDIRCSTLCSLQVIQASSLLYSTVALVQMLPSSALLFHSVPARSSHRIHVVWLIPLSRTSNSIHKSAPWRRHVSDWTFIQNTCTNIQSSTRTLLDKSMLCIFLFEFNSYSTSCSASFSYVA